MSAFRVRFEIAGGHVHCRLFCAPGFAMTGALCGTFVVRKGEEFSSLVRAMDGCDFICDSADVGIVEASAA